MVSNKTNRSYGEHDLDMEVTSQGQIVISEQDLHMEVTSQWNEKTV